jgi:hypothetical protein
VAGEVLVEQMPCRPFGDVHRGDHREHEVPADGAAVDPLLSHHRNGGQQVFHVPRCSEREHVGLLEAEQQLLELVEP